MNSLRSCTAAVLVSLPLLLSAVPAHASDGDLAQSGAEAEPATPEKKESSSSVWYGWQILAADGTATATAIGAGVALKLPPFVAIGALGYLIAPPLIHLFNKNRGAVAWSAGLRTGLPAVGAMLGTIIGIGEKGSGEGAWLSSTEKGLLIGLGAGLGTASLIDMAFLANRDKDAPKTDAKAVVHWQPKVAVTSRGAEFGVWGRF